MAGRVIEISISNVDIDDSVRVGFDCYGGRFLGSVEESDLSELCLLQCGMRLEDECVGYVSEVNYNCN